MGKENKEKVATQEKKYRERNQFVAERNAAFRAYAEKRAPWLVAEFDKNTVSCINSKFIANFFLNFFVKPYLNRTQITSNSRSKRPHMSKNRLQIPT